MLKTMRRDGRSLLWWLALAALLVSHGRALAEIGFRRVTPLDQIIDPVGHPNRYGLASAVWDTSGADTAARRDTLAFDSTAVPSPDTTRFISPDTTAADSLAGTTTPVPPAGSAGDSGSPQFEEEVGVGKGAAEPIVGESKAEEKAEPPPYHPTRVYAVGMPLEVKAARDSSTGYIGFIPRLAGQEMALPGALPEDAYLARQVALSDRETWRQGVLGKLPTSDKKSGEGINISIPVFKSAGAQRIFGGSNIGLNVSGSIQVDGSLTTEKRDELQRGNRNPTNYSFKVNQKQQFNIKGKVGEKVSVEIDQDSEKLFEFENNLRVTYKGGEDEIIQSIQAGNVDLNLRSKLATATAQHKGLFGFKTESKLGALKLTTITSLDKGEKNVKRISGGARTEAPVSIQPNSYVQGRYFFVDSTYRQNFRHYNENMDHIVTGLAPELIKIEVYRSVRQGESDNAVPGWAFANPRESNPPDSIPQDRRHLRASFLRLEPGADYVVDRQLGYFRLARATDDQTILAVAYSTAGGDFGDLDPADNNDANPFILKLIQPSNPQPTDEAVWNLMWRNVFDLRATGINEESFSAKIVQSSGQAGQGADSGPDINGQTRTYLAIFDLDQFDLGGRGEDGKIDPKFIDFQLGELRFPDLQPFAPVGWFYGPGEDRPNPVKLRDADRSPELYNRSVRELYNVTTSFSVQVQYSDASATYSLGLGVLEGSEEVLLDGRKLTRGSDYTVDYVTGSLTVLNKTALSPGADLEIRYETGQIFQLDTQTMLGVRADYELWDDSYIGGMLLYLNQKTLEQRVRVGGEPKRNSLWSLGARLGFKPEFLTRAVDWLPLIETDAPSSVVFEAEVDQVFPDPNSLNSPSTGDHNGVAYVDDFESVKRSTPLGITRRQWSDASFPLPDARGSGRWLRQRGRVVWYNPDQIKVTDIWPERETQAQNSTVQVLRVQFQPWWTAWNAAPPAGEDPEKSWGGIMRYLGPGYSDQSQSKYLEVWLRSETPDPGLIYFDLGKISEDVIPDGRLNTEDHPRPGYTTGDGSVTNDEDTGIDGALRADPQDSIAVNGLPPDYPLLPAYDDWNPNTSGRDWSRINGTEGNGTKSPADEGGRIPDSEDLSGNGFLDQANDFFRYRIDLSEGPRNRYIVGGQNNIKGWRLYRIPLGDTLSIGRPAFTDFDYVRLWFTGFSRGSSVMIAQMEIVGNEWREVRVSDGRGGTTDPISVAVINTHDNPEYNRALPPGVAGSVDPVTNLREKEQSLVLRVNHLGTGETGRAYKAIPAKMNLLEYRKLKMFVHGGRSDGLLVDRFGRPLDLEMFVRLGADTSSRNPRYYEYSQRLAPGWSQSNEIILDLDRLASLKFLRERDSARDYDILPDGDVIRVVGNASLRDIGFIEIGLKNHGQEIVAQDGVEMWVDEMRVSDIHRDAGWAATGSAHIGFADLLDVNADMTQYQADFHNLNERQRSEPADKLSGTFSSSLEVGQFFSPRIGLKLPLDLRFRQDIAVPKYKPSSDVRLSSISGERVGLWSRFMDDVLTADRFRRDPRAEGPMDSLISTDKQYTLSTSISKRRGDNPWIAYTLDNLRLTNASFQEIWGRDYINLLEYRKVKTAGAAYNLSFEKPLQIRWLGWAGNVPLVNKLSESTFRPLPSSINLGAGGTETLSKTLRRSGTISGDSLFTINRNYGAGWRPFDVLNFEYSQEIGANRIQHDTVRTIIAARLSTLDSTDYFVGPDTNRHLDIVAWREAKAANIERIKRKLFWRSFGYYFVDDNLNQAASGNFNPALVSWLGTETGYRAAYTWRWGQGLGPADRWVRTNANFNGTVTLRLPQLTSPWRSGGGVGEAAAKPVGQPFLAVRDESGQGEGKDEVEPAPPGGAVPRGGMDHYGKDSGRPTDKTGSGQAGGVATGGANLSLDDEPPPDVSVGQTFLAVGSLAPISPTEGDTAAADTTPAAKVKRKPPSPALLAKAFVSRLKDIQWSYTLTGDASNYGVAEGQADWAYRLGFTRDPGLSTVPGYLNRNSFTRSERNRFNSGLDITQNLVINNIELNFVENRTIGQQESGNSQRTVYQYFGSDGVTIKEVPAANWGIRWGGWERLPYISEWANSVSLDQSFQGSRTEQWRRVHPDSSREVTGIDYQKGFQPLLGITFAWKGGIGSNVRYNWNRDVSDQRTGLGAKGRNTTSSLSVTSSYTSRSGFRVPIPVWPFKNRRFNNSTTFALTFSSNNTKRESAARGAGFSSSSWSKSWSVTPTIEYSFSTTVRGGFRYTYSTQQNNLTSSRSQEFGFTVNISIRG